MLKEMGNQNATAVIEEEKDVDEASRDSSDESATEENKTKEERMIGDDDVEEDQDQDEPLDHIKEQDRHNEGDGVNSKEPISNETQGIEDDDVEDQGIEDTTLDSISNARVSHESDDLATSDAKPDDHVLEKINQDLSLHVNEVNNGPSRSIDEASAQGTEEEIGHPIVTKMSETGEEEVIDEVEILEQKSIDFVEVNDPNVSHNQEVLLLHSEASSTDDEMIEASLSDQEIEGEDEMEVEKAMMDTSLDVERYDNDTNNNLVSPQDLEDDHEAEKFYVVVAKSDDVADFKDLEIVETKANLECNLGYETSQLERHGEGTNSFKDLEIVELPTEFGPPRSKTSSIDHTRCVIEKSPSFEFTNPSTKPEDSGQTPMLYHTNKAPLRSLSTPVIARFAVEERTINTVDCDQKPPRTPLNGFLKDQAEETHLLEPQKVHQEAENRLEMITVEPQGSRERSSKGRVSGSFFFSSCICCARVEQLADP